MAKGKKAPVIKLRKGKAKFSNLKQIRVFDFNLIPRYLFKQIKGSDIDFDVLFKLNSMITSSPLAMIYVFADKDNIIKGFMWADVQPLTNSLSVHLLSINKEYYGTDVLKEIKKLTDEIVKTLQMKKCTWSTTRPRAFEKAGFIRSKQILMEI